MSISMPRRVEGRPRDFTARLPGYWLGRSTEVIHAYHMSCYASLPTIRLAAGLVATGKSRVDIVHTEMCTLHMDPSQHLPEQLVVQTLFADG